MSRYKSGSVRGDFIHALRNYVHTAPGSFVVSLILGSTRRFKLRHNQSREVVDYDLESGSLLIMLPGRQEAWEHAVLKTARLVDERINRTFRPHRDA